jgi:phage tail sheath protein FI
MAERLVSPGVFTSENDQSFIQEGVAQIGAAFIGPTQKGPAFRPTIVQGLEEFERVFGSTTTEMYTPQAVQNYLSEASRATIVRVLGLDGYSSTVNKSIVLNLTGSAGNSGLATTLALIHPSKVGVTIPTASFSGTPLNFALTISGANGSRTFSSMSVDPTSVHYYVNVLGTSPDTAYDAYVYSAFPTMFVSGVLAGSGSLQVALTTGELNFSGSTWGTYSNAATPWIRSQKIGSVHYSLFKFHTLSDGTAANQNIKVSIVGIKPAAIATDYGTFSVVIRNVTDTDSKIEVLEQFDGLTLDPTSPNYIAARIGTAQTVIDSNGNIYLDGDFPNNSKYVYLEVADGLTTAPIETLPYGFDAPKVPVNKSNIPAPAYVTTRYYTPSGTTTAVANTKVYFGFDFTNATSLAYLDALPSGSSTQTGLTIANSADTGFDLLESLTATDITDITATTATSLRKFTVPFQGGFDGQNPAQVRATGANITSTNTQGFDLSDSTKAGARAYNQAITALSNPESFDINLLVMPGVVYSQHTYIITQGINMVEARGDCFLVLDADILGSTVNSVINAVQGLDTSYAATYYPWVKVKDTNTGKHIWVPPSVVIPGVYAFNDRVGDAWYAPAGLNRGGIGSALQVRFRLAKTDKDDLYDGRVNPIVSFPGQGIVVWGQKTLQHQASALDRINVRRLLIEVKKFFASTARYLVFEQNVEATRNRFLSIVNPYLSNVQERNGLYAFKVKMDETNNTNDLIDRNILVGQIYLQPARSAESIQLEFNILPTGATFPQ